MGTLAGKKAKKYIFITGGVSSSLGKGLASASLAALLERRGIKLAMLKMDPYINVDPGTMSPTQHGEVYVTEDGAETDLDLGHYERFTRLTLQKKNNFTTGQVYLQVIENERDGKYLGKTVQVVPHITEEIKRRIHLAAEDSDLLLAEIGGTVGDIESGPFLEAIRQFAQEVGEENVLFIHLVLVPYLSAAGEHKTKPAQHSVRELRGLGLFPHIILCRAEEALDEEIKKKIANFCHVGRQNVFTSIDMDSIYELPLNLYHQGMDERVIDLLGMWATRPDVSDLEKVVYALQNPKKKVKIGIVGKYTDLIESYKSLDEALRHAAIALQVELEMVYLDSEALENEHHQTQLNEAQALLVPGGFGTRGIEGKINAIKYARENKIPFFGICLGMQLACIEYARNVVGLSAATSQEFGQGTGQPVIHYLPGQSGFSPKGGSMRLGAFECQLQKGTLAYNIYGKERIIERHRHRLEFNNEYLKQFEESGMIFSGKHPELGLVELVELEDHPFFIACQFHPEFKSRPFEAHPLFYHFIKKAIK